MNTRHITVFGTRFMLAMMLATFAALAFAQEALDDAGTLEPAVDTSADLEPAVDTSADLEPRVAARDS